MNNYVELDTPALVVDRKGMEENMRRMQDYADRHHVNLRPHTKTHKTPELALKQQEFGCKGIAVAKVGEAEVMAEAGLKDILIANEIVVKRSIREFRSLLKRELISSLVWILSHRQNL